MPHSGVATSPAARGDAARFMTSLRPEALGAPESGIVEVFNYGRDRAGLIPLWVGEGDLPTPRIVLDAIQDSLGRGETFYTHQRGVPAVRTAIADYMTRIYGSPFAEGGQPFSADRFFLTIGGMQALQIAIRLVAGSGDDVLVSTPAWPNFIGALSAAGAHAVEVPLRFQKDATGVFTWSLDHGRIAAAITPRTRAIVVNTPANPTGWTATDDDLARLLALARQHGLWIIADEIYGRFVYEKDRAPSFHDHITAHDQVLFVQTCSKNWAMTGLRIGWLEAPPELGAVIENLIQYSSSGVAVPLQRGAAAAVTHGEGFFQEQLARIKQSRTLVCDAFARQQRIAFAPPPGAFYLFFQIAGEMDTRRAALELVDLANVGLAPGSGFGSGGAPFMRLCFARDPAQIAEFLRRFEAWLVP